MSKADPLFPVVNGILFDEWDPMGVRRQSPWRDEYGSYARTILSHLRAGADQFKLAQLLAEFRRTWGMGDDETDRRIAGRLVELVVRKRRLGQGEEGS